METVGSIPTTTTILIINYYIMKRIEIAAILALFIGLIAYISSRSESIRDRNHRWKEEVMYSVDVPRLTEI